MHPRICYIWRPSLGRSGIRTSDRDRDLSLGGLQHLLRHHHRLRRQQQQQQQHAYVCSFARGILLPPPSLSDGGRKVHCDGPARAAAFLQTKLITPLLSNTFPPPQQQQQPATAATTVLRHLPAQPRNPLSLLTTYYIVSSSVLSFVRRPTNHAGQWACTRDVISLWTNLKPPPPTSPCINHTGNVALAAGGVVVPAAVLVVGGGVIMEKRCHLSLSWLWLSLSPWAAAGLYNLAHSAHTHTLLEERQSDNEGRIHY